MRNDVTLIKLTELVDFENQPFKVLDDEAMDELCESVKTVGVLVPIIVRAVKDGKYEIISGHRRKRACEREGIDAIPAVTAKLNDDEAAILLVDSNLHRENILPSEKAYAYKMKLDAMKHQGIRNNFTCGQIVHKSRDAVAQFGESGRQVQRYIRLTELIYQLLDKVDIKLIPVTAGAEVSYVDVRNQAILNDILDSESCGLSLQQAIKLKQHYLDGDISHQLISDIITGTEKKEKGKVVLKYDRLRKYFPPSYTPKECEEALWKILDEWFEKR